MKISNRPLCLWLLGMVGMLAAGWAQVPLGPQFRVDPSDLVPYARYPSGLAFSPDGTLWIAWESHAGSDPFSGIGARSVAPSGVLSRPLLPLPGTAGIPLLVPVSGGLAVFGQDALPAIELRRLSAAGKLRGHPVLIQKAAGLFNSYAVTPLPGGGFFVVFIGDDCPGHRCASYGVFGRVLDSLGQPLTAVFPVNETRSGDQLPTGVVADPEGNVSVIWYGPVPDPLQYAVFTRRFSRAGKPLGGERRISVQTQGAEGGAAADAQGNFVVTWAANTSDTTTAIFARRFSSLGDPLGDEFPVSQEVADAEVRPKVAMSPTGDFFIVWESFGCAGCDYVDIKGRLFYAGGTSEDEILVDEYRNGAQTEASVAFGPSGWLAVAWLGDSETHYEAEVDARLFMVPPR
jgi:hypothetical protein